MVEKLLQSRRSKDCCVKNRARTTKPNKKSAYVSLRDDPGERPLHFFSLTTKAEIDAFTPTDSSTLRTF